MKKNLIQLLKLQEKYMLPKPSDATSEDDLWYYGDREGFYGKWMLMKHPHWMTYSTMDKMEYLGVNTNKTRANEFFNFADGRHDIYNFLCDSSDGTDESLKVMLNKISLEMKRKNCSIYDIMAPETLNKYIKYKNEIPYRAEKILEELMKCRNFDEVISEYKEEFGFDENVIINQVCLDNISQFDRAKTDQKIFNWLVGQIMKASNGKIGPDKIIAILKERMR